MKTFLVVNPHSANKSTGRKWPEIAAQLSKTLGEFGHAFTQRPMEAATLARNAIRDGYECIVAVGGDGTINEVVNGFFENGKVLNPNAALAVLPRGTGGDFRKTFGWDGEVKSAIERLATDDTDTFDVGLLEYTDPSGNKAERYFANICSFGVGGLVDQEANRSSKALGGKVSFMLASAKAMVKYSDQEVRFSADDGQVEAAKITSFAVANGRYFGGGMCVAPDARPNDGLFDVTIWTGYTLLDFVAKSKALYDGSHTRYKGTRTFRCKKVRAESDHEVLLDVDGEQPGRLPCQMTIVPGAIRLKI